MLALVLLVSAWAQDAPQIPLETVSVPQIYLPSHKLIPSGQVVVHLTLCPPNEDTPECDARRRQWDRKKHIEELVPLLMEEFADKNMDKALRDHITAIQKWMQEHPYD